MPKFDITDMIPAHAPQVAALWHEGWHDGHAEIVPEALTKLRTLDSFETRSADLCPATRVAISQARVIGFCMVQGDELYQMYVAPQGRGTGVAHALMTDAETRIKGAGYATAWLACAIGNERAAAFYRKCGWHMARLDTVDLDTSEGAFPLELWRFEKAL